MAIKYLVCPGPVRSQNDGDVHHIGFAQLVKLYGVNPAECLNRDSSLSGYAPGFLDSLTVLRPRYDGNYALPVE